MAEAKKKVEATKPTPEEKQAAAEAEVDALVARAKKALDEFENLDQKQVDRIVAKASIAALNKHLVLAKMAVDETGRGLVEDKATKNIFACEHVTHYMAGQKMNNTIIEYINGMEVVKVFNKDADSYERFRKDVSDYRNVWVRSSAAGVVS